MKQLKIITTKFNDKSFNYIYEPVKDCYRCWTKHKNKNRHYAGYIIPLGEFNSSFQLRELIEAANDTNGHPAYTQREMFQALYDVAVNERWMDDDE